MKENINTIISNINIFKIFKYEYISNLFLRFYIQYINCIKVDLRFLNFLYFL